MGKQTEEAAGHSAWQALATGSYGRETSEASALPATIADCGKECYDTTLSEMKGERLLSLWYVFIYVYFLGLNKQALLTLLTQRTG